jgi:hypothetical protein
MVYGQTELTHDLMNAPAAAAHRQQARDGARLTLPPRVRT